MSARSLPVGIGAKAKQQLDHSRVPLCRRVVKEGSAVPGWDMSQCRIGQQFAFSVFQEGIVAASHHERQHMSKHRAIARKSKLERRTLDQLKSAVCIIIANSAHKIVQRPLFVPSLRNLAVEAIVRRIPRRGRFAQDFTGVYDVGGRPLKQAT